MIDNLEEKLDGTIPIIREELIELVNSWGRTDSYDYSNICECTPKECYPLENLDISQITDLSYIFINSPYNGDLSKWNTSNVENMENLFYRSKFNNDSLKDWDVSNVKNMSDMFYDSLFNGDLSNWDVSNVENCEWMFAHSKFNNNSISNWDISNFKFMKYMFYNSDFNYDILKWNISNVIDMTGLFENSRFNGDISKWNFIKQECNDMFRFNISFYMKYFDNNSKINTKPPLDSKDFIKWFKENKINIGNLNITKEDLIELDDYLSTFDEKELINGN